MHAGPRVARIAPEPPCPIGHGGFVVPARVCARGGGGAGRFPRKTTGCPETCRESVALPAGRQAARRRVGRRRAARSRAANRSLSPEVDCLPGSGPRIGRFAHKTTGRAEAGRAQTGSAQAGCESVAFPAKRLPARKRAANRSLCPEDDRPRGGGARADRPPADGPRIGRSARKTTGCPETSRESVAPPAGRQAARNPAPRTRLPPRARMNP